MFQRYFWNPDRDRLLRQLAGEGEDIAAIVTQLCANGGVVTATQVRRRIKALGIRYARRGVWNASRDERFIALWMQEPKLTLAEIADQLGFAVSPGALSTRGQKLGLPGRYGVHTSTDEKCIAIRSPFAGARFHDALEKPAPRVKRVPLETPCPFFEADGKQCCVMVDRRPDRNGVKPSQYCPAHKARVLPISRGAFMGLGTVATCGRGHRFG